MSHVIVKSTCVCAAASAARTLPVYKVQLQHCEMQMLTPSDLLFCPLHHLFAGGDKCPEVREAEMLAYVADQGAHVILVRVRKEKETRCTLIEK